MSDDPIVRLAKLRIIKASADLEFQLSQAHGGGPSIEILRRLQDRAAESLAALAFVDFVTERDKAIVLQNDVKRYDEWFGCLRDIITEGVAYDKEFTDADRRETIDMLTSTIEGAQQAIDLGLVDEVPRDA